jgi:hypothetical protein
MPFDDTPLINVDNIVERARELLHDTNSDSAQYRWTDDMLRKWVADGQREIVGQFPEYMILTDGTQPTTIPLPSPPVDVNQGEFLSVHQICSPAILDYVCARAFAKDAEEGNADVSAGYMKSFYEKLKL